MRSDFADVWSDWQHVAHYRLMGPRSVLTQDDPEGRGFWFDPVVRALITNRGSGRFNGWSIYRVPRMLERGAATLIRSASWNWRDAKQRCKNGDATDQPVEIAYWFVNVEELPVLNAALLGMERALSAMPFPVEGLPSATDTEPGEGPIVPPRNGYRILYDGVIDMRFRGDDFGASAGKAVDTMFGVMDQLSSYPRSSPALGMIERYEFTSETSCYFRDVPAK